MVIAKVSGQDSFFVRLVFFGILRALETTQEITAVFTLSLFVLDQASSVESSSKEPKEEDGNRSVGTEGSQCGQSRRRTNGKCDQIRGRSNCNTGSRFGKTLGTSLDQVFILFTIAGVVSFSVEGICNDKGIVYTNSKQDEREQ